MVPSSVEAEQRVLVADDRSRLGRGDEAGADPDAVGAEGQRGGQARGRRRCRRRRRQARGRRPRRRSGARAASWRPARCGRRPRCPGRRRCRSPPRPPRRRGGPCRTCSRRARRCWWHSSTTSRGTPRPATNTRAPSAMIVSTCRRHVAGHGGEQVDAEGLVGQLLRGADLLDHLARCPWSRRRGSRSPPASETAATRRW